MPNLEGLQAVKRLISFLESYAEQDEKFAQALNAEMESFLSGRKRPVKPEDPYRLIDELGDIGFREHLHQADPSELQKYARFLGIKTKRGKDDLPSLREKILVEMEKSLNHGSVFTKENSEDAEK